MTNANVSASDPGREFDIVLLGATGFTGGLTARYLARNAPHGCRWAVAGRNQSKLDGVLDTLAADRPGDAGLSRVHTIVADSEDYDSMLALARRTRVVITTVGPYLRYGEALARACAESGTDYVDLTGEPEFVDQVFLRHHERALATGARLVHSCGFDSIPHDLGAYYTVGQLDSGAPVRLRGVVRSNAQFSGGTLASAMLAFSRPRQMRSAMAARRAREERPKTRRIRGIAGKPHRDGLLGYWLLPLPTIDPFVVVRSASALAAYGPDFGYSHYAGMKTLRYTLGGLGGFAALALAAQVPALRKQVSNRIKPGEGPSESRRAKSWFTVDFVAESVGQTLHTRVSGGDPGYDETAKMLAESALCLAFDDNPKTSGQVTTAVAMGDNLLARLEKAGMTFEVVAD